MQLLSWRPAAHLSSAVPRCDRRVFFGRGSGLSVYFVVRRGPHCPLIKGGLAGNPTLRVWRTETAVKGHSQTACSGHTGPPGEGVHLAVRRGCQQPPARGSPAAHRLRGRARQHTMYAMHADASSGSRTGGSGGSSPGAGAGGQPPARPASKAGVARKETPSLQVRQRPQLATGAALQWQQLAALTRKNLTIRQGWGGWSCSGSGCARWQSLHAARRVGAH
jgi:hypothetical protein